MFLGIYLPYKTLARAFIAGLKKDDPENDMISQYEKVLESLYDEDNVSVITEMNCGMEEMFNVGAFYDGSAHTPYILFINKRMVFKAMRNSDVYKYQIPSLTDVQQLLAAYEKSRVRKIFGKMTEDDVGLFDEPTPSY